MTTLFIVHNPSAGNGDHTRSDILDMLDRQGHDVRYVSTRENNWERFNTDKIDILCVAGGDGTVRKVVEVIHRDNLNKDTPIRILPLGTANNIAKSLGISMGIGLEGAIPNNLKMFDHGHIKGLKDQKFFLESVGLGIFPELISEMQKQGATGGNASENLKLSLTVLLGITKEYRAEKAKIILKDLTLDGSFLLMELMNIQCLGPNLELSPDSDPGDGYLELVIILEKDRDKLVEYLEHILNDKSPYIGLPKFVKIFRVKKAKIKYAGFKLHVDDNLIENHPGKNFTLKIIPGTLKFNL